MEPASHFPAAPSFLSAEALSRLGRLIRKELLEILRDRRTIITLVAMPLLLYPLLSVAFQQFFLASSIDPSKGQVYRLGFETEHEMAVFSEFLLFGQQLLQGTEQAKKPGKEAAPPGPRLEAKTGPDLEALLREGEVDLALRLQNAGSFQLPLKKDLALHADLIFLSNNPAGLGAVAFIEKRLAAVHEHHLEARLHVPGAQPKVALMRVSRSALAVAGGDGMISLAALVPLILILMTITGAVYPAIDLTAGERERGTLEILVAAPVPRLELLFAKYVTVLSVAVLTALVNLVSMILTLLFSGLAAVVLGGGLSVLLVLQLFGLLLLFAAFFSAVLLSIASFARSFKEAQAYLIPLMLASLGPGLIGMMPGLELSGPLAAVPLVNIVLLARDLVQGGADPVWALVVVGTTLVYAAAAISLAARIFGAEEVLFNNQTGWSDLWQRPREPQETAPVSAALWCLVLMIPVHFALQGLTLFAGPWLPRGGQFVALGIAGVILFGFLPAVSAYLGRVRPGTGFALVPARPAAYLGGLVLGFSLWPVVFRLLTLLLEHRSQQLQEQLQTQLEALRRDRETLLPLLAGSLVIQAVMEELFFRGYLFGALRGKLSAGASIVISALLFGLLHVVLGGALGLERMLPSTLLGLMLGWVRSCSGSVVPGMILHALHNALLNVLPTWVEDTKDWGWVAGGIGGTLLGMGLIWLGRQSFIDLKVSNAPSPLGGEGRGGG